MCVWILQWLSSVSVSTNIIGPADIELDLIMPEMKSATMYSGAAINQAFTINRSVPLINDDEIQIPEQGISLEKLERGLLVQALERTHHNQSKAASLLNISRHTMRYRLEKHGLL